MARRPIPKVTLAEATEAFLRGEADRGLDPGTIRIQRRTLAALARQAPRGEHTATRNLTPHHIKDAILDLWTGESPAAQAARVVTNRGRPRTGRKGSTLTLDRSTLRYFVEMLRREGWIDPGFRAEHEISTTKAKREEGERRDQPTHLRIPHEQWGQVIDCAAHPRDRLMVTLGLWWALRSSSLAAIRWEDLHRDEGWARLYNVKMRRVVAGGRVPIGPVIARELEAYLAWFVPLYGEPEPSWPVLAKKLHTHHLSAGVTKARATWPIYPDQPMTPENVTRSIQRVLRDFYGPEVDLSGEGGHTLRRSGGRWVAANWGIHAAQRLLDHTTPEMTRRYIGWNEEDAALDEAMRFGTPDPEPEPVSQPDGQSVANHDQISREVPQPSEPLATVVDLFSRRRVA
jgi:integrase